MVVEDYCLCVSDQYLLVGIFKWFAGDFELTKECVHRSWVWMKRKFKLIMRHAILVLGYRIVTVHGICSKIELASALLGNAVKMGSGIPF